MRADGRCRENAMVADPAAADELQLSEAIVIEGLLWLSSYIAFRNKLIQLIVIIITFDNFDRSSHSLGKFFVQIEYAFDALTPTLIKVPPD
jgi:hypothetical protein